MKKMRPFLFAMFLAITCANISLHAQCVVPLGSSTNMFSTTFNRPTNIVVNNDLNTVLFIHRQDISVFGGNSGTYQYDISTDNGVTWQLNQGSLNPGSTSGVNAGRFPQVGLYNPAGNLDIASASLVYHGATVAGSDWNGYVSGSLLLDGAATATEHYNQAGVSNPFIAGGLCQSVPGTFWAIDAISDDNTNGNGIRILKGVYDAGDISWSVQTELMPDFNLDNGIPQLIDWNMAFDPSGMNGWAVLLTHLNGLSDYNYYPVFYNTTDGGATWSGPVQLDPATFSSITAVEPNPVCAREVDLVVDASGNPHALIGVFKKNQGDYSYAINSVPFGHMFDFTYNGNWSAVKIAQTSYLNNDFFTPNPTYNRPQVSRSDDGNKIVFTWVESELPFIPGIYAVLDETNYAPNLKAVTYDLPTGTLSCAKNYALVCPSDLNGKMYQTSVSPNMIEDGDVYTVPVVMTILNESGDPNAPAQYYYLNDLSFTAADFTAASTTSSMTITADGNLNICAGQSVELTASESSSYLWSTGETTQTITAYGGAYWVVNPDESTCIAGSNSIVVDAVQPFSMVPYSSTVFCPGGVDTVDISFFTWAALPLDASIVWNTGQTTDVITANSPGIYTASINGCWAVDTVLVEDLDAPSNDDICDASELAAGTAMSFQLACATVEAGEIVPPLDPLFDPASQDGWFDDSYAGAPVVNNTVWYRFTAPSSGNVSISTDGLDSQLALYSSSDNSCSGELTLIAANDDGGTEGASLINKAYCFEAGKTYFIQVDLPLYWYLVHSGTILMNAAWDIPAITNNNNVLQSDAAEGNQWYDQNGPIAGATGQTYIPTVTGNYYTIVTVDGCSTAPSNTINVTSIAQSDQTWIDLDGTNDFLDFGQDNILAGKTQFTVEMKVHIDGNVGEYTLLGQRNSQSNRTLVLQRWAGGLFVLMGDNYGYCSFLPSCASAQIHFAVVYDGAGTENSDRLKLFIDGELQTLSFEGTIPNTTIVTDPPANLVLGCEHNGDNSIDQFQFVHGQFGEFCVWDYPLSPGEINDRIIPEVTGTEAGLVEYFHFDNGIPEGDNTGITSFTGGMGVSTITPKNMEMTGVMSNFTSQPVNNNPVDTSLTVEGPIIYANANDATYQWYTCDGTFTFIEGANSQVFTAPGDGYYAVEVTQNGCSAFSACVQILTIGVPEISTGHFTVYPNPVSDELIIENEGNTQLLPFKILNALGQTVTEGKVAEKAVVDTQQFASGIYLLIVHQGEKMVETKFVKK